MISKSIVLAAILAASAMPAAEARDIRSMMMGGQKGMTVSASFQTVVPLPAGAKTVEDETRATESARKSLYEIASRECVVITQVFKGECRMRNLNVRSYVQDRGNGIRQISVSANATYMVIREAAAGDSGGDNRL